MELNVKLLYKLLLVVAFIGASAPTAPPGSGTPINAPTPNNPVQYNFAAGTVISSSAVNSNGYKIYNDINNIVATLNDMTGTSTSYVCPFCVTAVTTDANLNTSITGQSTTGRSVQINLGVVSVANGGTGCTTYCFPTLSRNNVYTGTNSFNAGITSGGTNALGFTQFSGGQETVETTNSNNAAYVYNGGPAGMFWTTGFNPTGQGTLSGVSNGTGFGPNNKGYGFGYNYLGNNETDIFSAGSGSTIAYDFFNENTSSIPATETALIGISRAGQVIATGGFYSFGTGIGPVPYDRSSGGPIGSDEHIEHGTIAAGSTNATLHFSTSDTCTVSGVTSNSTNASVTITTNTTTSLIILSPNPNAAVNYECIGY